MLLHASSSRLLIILALITVACSAPSSDGPDSSRPRVDARTSLPDGSEPPEMDGSSPGDPDASTPGDLDGSMPMADASMSPPDPEPDCVRTVRVANNAALPDAISDAQPGDCIILADGRYTFPRIRERATMDRPIVIRAENRGAAEVNSGSLVWEGAAYVTVEGLLFTSDGVITFIDSDHCRLSRTRVRRDQSGGEADWITLAGTSHHNRIDHDDVGPQNVIGNMVMFAGAGAQVVQYNRVDHNYFHDITNTGGNGWEAIRLGLSGLSLSSGHNIVEYNLFRGATGDPETISVKTGENVIRYNTFRATDGEITLRHGDGSLVYGNFMLADGLAAARGIRVCDSDHRVFNNYIEGITAAPAIQLRQGNADEGATTLTSHFRVYRTHVVHNTIVDSRGIQLGGGSGTFPPADCVIANNIVRAGTADLISDAGSDTRFMGNIVFPTGSGTRGEVRPDSEIRVEDPELTRSGDVFRLAAGSPAIDDAIGTFDYVVEDFDREPRATPDVGADEYSGSPAGGPLDTPDVGPSAP